MTEKLLLRKKYLQLRENLSEELVLNNEDRLLKNLRSFNLALEGKKIACYMSIKNEMRTKKLIEYLFEQNSHVYLPKMQAGTKTLKFLEVDSMDKLKKNKFGIYEPFSSNDIESRELDYVFLPCVCFDKEGYRIGMGEGYYDQSLESISQSKTVLIILAHEMQHTESCYPENHDIKSDFCITNEQTYKFY